MSSISREQFLNYCKEKQKLDQKYGDMIVQSAKIKEKQKDLKKESKLESKLETQKTKLDDPVYLEKLEARRLKQLERKRLAYHAKKEALKAEVGNTEDVSDSDRTPEIVSPEPEPIVIKNAPKKFIGNYF